jgi:hypothetical protein
MVQSTSQLEISSMGASQIHMGGTGVRVPAAEKSESSYNFCCFVKLKLLSRLQRSRNVCKTRNLNRLPTKIRKAIMKMIKSTSS